MKTKTRSTKTAMVSPKRSATTAMLSNRFDGLRVRVNDARRALVGLGSQGVRQLVKHPVGAVVGAFATGMAVAKIVGRG